MNENCNLFENGTKIAENLLKGPDKPLVSLATMDLILWIHNSRLYIYIMNTWAMPMKCANWVRKKASRKYPSFSRSTVIWRRETSWMYLNYRFFFRLFGLFVVFPEFFPLAIGCTRTLSTSLLTLNVSFILVFPGWLILYFYFLNYPTRLPHPPRFVYFIER